MNQVMEMNRAMEIPLRLGALQGEFRRSRRFVLGLIIGAVTALLLGLGMVVLMLFATPSGNSGDLVAAYVMIIIFFAGGVFGLWLWQRSKNLRVQLFDGGFTVARGSKVSAFTWDDIESFQANVTDVYIDGIYTGKQFRYMVKKKDGERVLLTKALKGVERVGKRIGSEVLARQLPHAIAEINNNRAVSFDGMTIRREGLERKGEQLAWTELEKAEVAGGYISLHKRGKRFAWARLNYGLTPNAEVLLALIEHLRHAC